MEWYNLIWVAAGLISGLTSFGGNMLAVPVLSLFVPARDAVALGCLSGAAIAIVMTALYWRDVAWRSMIVITIGGILGIPIGVAFLALAPARLILFSASASIGVFLLWDLIGKHYVKKSEKSVSWLAAFGLGVAAGIMCAATGMGGPPVALYALWTGWSRKNTLGSVSLIFVIFLFPQLPAQWIGGVITPDLIWTGFVGAVAAAIGVFISIPMAKYVNAELFRRLLIGMIAISAIVLLIRGLNA